jgi:carbon starvation protein
MAIAYRYYSAFLAAKVAVLDDTRTTPAVKFNDGQNYHPTGKWVLFGHHFAAISGAGPLIGPVLAAQFGYMPGLLWIVIGVCLGGAVQDFLVLAASLRRNGKSLAQIAFEDVGRVAGTASMIAILFIIVIALAGLGKVVVNALGGESVKYPAGSSVVVPGIAPPAYDLRNPKRIAYQIPAESQLKWNKGTSSLSFDSAFTLTSASQLQFQSNGSSWKAALPSDPKDPTHVEAIRVVPGSSWGTFTIVCTIPIALLVGLYMNRLRPGKTVEASVIGAVLTLAATFAGGYVAGKAWGGWFNWSSGGVTIAMAIYGFVASVLPVWILLAPRDYLSSFLKIGTIALLVIGVIVANPPLHAPAINHVFMHGGPTVPGSLFPFLFITIMCGAISGFHALVSSGTTPKMVRKESDARTIGYGAMLIEGLVGVIAMIAAAGLPSGDFYAMNTDLAKMPMFADKIAMVGGGGGIEHINDYERLTNEPSLRGRTGGGVTLAVGMAHIFDEALKKFSIASESALENMWKYWYHFAIMFEALFILTTIDAGTRIGRFLLQEALGKVVHPKLAQPNWWPGAIVSTLLVVVAWTYFINANNFAAIWSMFGVANQMLAAIALSIISAYLVNEGRVKYLWVTVIPMCVVTVTTSTAAVELLVKYLNTLQTQWHAAKPDHGLITNSAISAALTLAMLGSAYTVIICSMARCMRRPTESRVSGLAVVATS